MALVLTRKENEITKLFDENGNEVKIWIGRINTSTVQLCIEAPSSIRILRGELGPKLNPYSLKGRIVKTAKIIIAAIFVGCTFLACEVASAAHDHEDEPCCRKPVVKVLQKVNSNPCGVVQRSKAAYCKVQSRAKCLSSKVLGRVRSFGCCK